MTKSDVMEHELSLSRDSPIPPHLSPVPSQRHSVGSNAELIPMPITPVIERWLQASPTCTLHICQLASVSVHALLHCRIAMLVGIHKIYVR